ncbi:protein FAM136A [Galendromus occidentalis]|uniref:Protein FAM136A n=1 Tax=Galendromus occidentalis TaxID=34638 RepID=A0AAJ6QR85_9ACAR|nr:protein FAM136A [Galendromus occidentalis]
MAADASQRVQKAMENAFDEIDKAKVRRVQRDMHLCAAKCCDDSTKSAEQVHNCIENCQDSFTSIRGIIAKEFSHFQRKLELCAKKCESDMRDTIPVKATQADVDKYSKQFDSCIVKCADENIDGIPTMLRRLKELLTSF